MWVHITHACYRSVLNSIATHCRSISNVYSKECTFAGLQHPCICLSTVSFWPLPRNTGKPPTQPQRNSVVKSCMIDSALVFKLTGIILCSKSCFQTYTWLACLLTHSGTRPLLPSRRDMPCSAPWVSLLMHQWCLTSPVPSLPLCESLRCSSPSRPDLASFKPAI